MTASNIKRRMIMRFLARLGVAAALGVLYGATLGSVGHAAEPDCKTVTTHLKDRPDNGHGTPSVWALDTLTRTVKVCHAPEVQKAAVAIETWTYTATLVDEGTFVTQPSAHGSPNAGAAIAAQHGTVHGTAEFAKFTAPHDWIAWDDSINGKTFTGSAPSSTSDWLKHLWKDGFGGSQITAYTWTYKTCVEQWVDSSEESNNDGQADTAGDITGKACPSASPSSHGQPTPSTSATAATLPVTGSSTEALAIGGGIALAAGVGIVIAARRRKRIDFTA